jgi:hypothetical protein
VRGAKPGQSRSPPHASPRRQRPPARTLRVPRRRRRSGQRSRQERTERRHAARVASQHNVLSGEMTAVPTGERTVSGPRFPIGLRGATTAYVASTNANAATRRVHPGRHVPVARDPSASAGDESSQGSTGELPPTTSHGYAEWDFSGVPDLVMFRRFLDATDYWFGYSDDSSAGSYDPAQECCIVITNDQANAANAAEASERRGSPRSGNWNTPGCRAKRPSLLTTKGGRRQHAVGSSARARGQARGGVPRGAAASSLHRRGSLRMRRTRARVGPTGPRRINANFNVGDRSTPP